MSVVSTDLGLLLWVNYCQYEDNSYCNVFQKWQISRYINGFPHVLVFYVQVEADLILGKLSGKLYVVEVLMSAHEGVRQHLDSYVILSWGGSSPVKDVPWSVVKVVSELIFVVMEKCGWKKKVLENENGSRSSCATGKAGNVLYILEIQLISFQLYLKKLFLC